MRLKTLEIQNLASIENAVIDFEQNPLSTSDVFLITGKTGAGKSTILDAICLALFAQTPRLNSTQMQGGTRDNETEIGVKDTRQLLRRGATCGSARLVFSGRDGVDYEAIWSVSRAHNKISGNLKSDERQLTNLSSGVIFTKKKEIEAEIFSAIGLDFNQFCRTTMLAQGEFTRFLSSNDGEKADILEKITGVDIYTKIGRKIYEISKEKKEECEKISERISLLKTLSDEEISAEKLKIQELEIQTKTLKSESEKNAKILQKKEEKLSAEKTISEQKEIFSQSKNEFIALKNGEFFLEKTAENSAENLKKLTSWLENENSNAKIYENSQTVCALISSVCDGKTRIWAQNQEISKSENALSAEKFKLDFCKKEVENASEILQNEMKIFAEIQAKLSAQNLPELRGKKENLQTLKTRLETLEKETARRKILAQEIAENSEKLENSRKKITELKPQILASQTAFDAQKSLLEKQKESVEKWAKSMRAKLQIGDDCPVCRQKIAILPNETALDELFLALENDFKKSENELNFLKNEENKLLAQEKTLHENLEKQKANFEKDNAVSDAENAVKIAAEKAEISGENFKNVDEIFAEILEKIAQAEKLENSKNEIQKSVENARNLLDEKKNSLAKTEREIAILNEKIQTSKKFISEKSAEILGNEIKIDQILNAKNWRENPQIFAEELQEKSKLFSEKNQERLKLESLEKTQKLQLENAKNEIEKILKIAPNWNKISPTFSEEIPDFSKKSSVLFSIISQAKNLYEIAQKTISQIDENLAEFSDETLEKLKQKIENFDKEFEAKNQEKGKILQLLEQNEKQKNEQILLQKTRDEKRAEHEKWERLNKMFGSADGGKFRKIAQSYVLTNLIFVANGYMKTLSDRYRLRVEPGTFVILLEDAFQGFVARAASTISGGESFLVSLALALALSDIGQRLAVDTIFIDEGFGTLSGEPLQKAIETLRTLHKKGGRHVGIISHVEELKEKIPVQIQVLQEGNSSKSQVQVIDKFA